MGIIILIGTYFLGYLVGYKIRRGNEIKATYECSIETCDPPKNPYGFDVYEVKSQMTSDGVRYVIYKNDRILTYRNLSGNESYFTYTTQEAAEAEVEKLDI